MKRGLKRTPLPSNNIKVCLKFTNVLSNIKCRSFKHTRQLQARQLQMPQLQTRAAASNAPASNSLGAAILHTLQEHNLRALRWPPHPRGHTEALLGEKWEEEWEKKKKTKYNLQTLN